MDPNKLSDQFIPQTHFPLQTFVGMSKEAAEHLHASGGKDWSKALDEHEADHGVRGLRLEIHHQYSMENEHMAMGRQIGDPTTKELFHAGTDAYRSSLMRSDMNKVARDNDRGAVVAVTVHPRNPVRFPESYGGEPAVETPTGGHSGIGWKHVTPSMVPPHDVWEQYRDIPTVNEHGKPVDREDISDLFPNRLVVTDPGSAMTYVGVVPGGADAKNMARKRWNEKRKASEQAAEEARKAKRAEAARKRRASKKENG